MVAWWRSRGPIGWAERTDVYHVPGPDMGIKLREGRFEVKGRTAEHGLRALAPGVSGRVESWVKWSYESPISFDGVAVAKRRSLRMIAPDGSAREPMAPGAVGVELTTLEVRGAAWWTVGLEALDDGTGDPVERLLAAAATALAGTPGLSAAQSAGYPAWLLSLD